MESFLSCPTLIGHPRFYTPFRSPGKLLPFPRSGPIMEFLDLPQLLSAAGTVRLPGSKSISNRVLLLAALAEGETEVRDLLASDDTGRMLDALKNAGCRRHITWVGKTGALPVAAGASRCARPSSFSAMPAPPSAR